MIVRFVCRTQVNDASDSLLRGVEQYFQRAIFYCYRVNDSVYCVISKFIVR